MAKIETARAAVPVLLPVSATVLPPAPPTPGQPWRDSAGVVHAHHRSAGDTHWIDVYGVGRFLFRESEPGVQVAADSDWEHVLDTYQRYVLPMVLHALWLEVLHASAVVGSDGVVALCGYSGMGKSTLAHALSRRGYSAYADDALAFTVAGSRLETVPMPFRLRLRPASVAHFGADNPAAQSDLPQGAPLAAICLLEQTADADDPSPRADRLAPGAAWLALLPHAYCFTLDTPERKRHMVRAYTHLTRSVPTIRVRYASGLAGLSDVAMAIERAVSTVRGDAA